MPPTKRYKRVTRGRATLAQEVQQARRAGKEDGGGGGGTLPATAAASLQRQALEHAATSHTIDSDLIDAYMDMSYLTTIHDILHRCDPRYNMEGIREGIEHGNYRWALEELLPNPPPRDHFGGLLPDNRARMLERLGRYEEAERLYRDHAAESAGHTPTQLAMARILEHLGRREESAEALARACRLDPDCRLAFEAGMRPDPRQLDPSAVPLRLIVPMSVISAAGTMRSRAELSAASLLVQAECGLDLYPRSGTRLPGCAGLGADMERFHHLVVEDILPYYTDTYERPYYYDLTDQGIDMIKLLGERLDKSGGDGTASARIAASARRIAQIGSPAVLEEACAMSPAAEGPTPAAEGRAAGLEALRGTAGRILREIGNGIAFGETHSLPMKDKARLIPDMLSHALGAPAGQWAVAAALAGDTLALCASVAFGQRPHPRTSALGPPYHDIQDLLALLVGYCRARDIVDADAIKLTEPEITTTREAEEITRDMIKAVFGP